jgi:hypothetical protein
MDPITKSRHEYSRMILYLYRLPPSQQFWTPGLPIEASGTHSQCCMCACRAAWPNRITFVHIGPRAPAPTDHRPTPVPVPVPVPEPGPGPAPVQCPLSGEQSDHATHLAGLRARVSVEPERVTACGTLPRE